MAGSALERGAKERIGAFYLKGLLGNSETTSLGGLPLADFHATLREETGIQLPDAFSELFGLSNLRFLLHEVNILTLPRLYTGRPLEQQESPTIRNSIFTLEVAQRVDLDNFPPEHEMRVPMYVRVAGVNNATNRIVAATYDCETGELITVAVSIGDNESDPADEKKLGLGINRYWRGFFVHVENHLLTDFNNPYEAPGIITDAMVRQTAQSRPMAHTQLLMARVKVIEPIEDRNKVYGWLNKARLDLAKDEDVIVINCEPFPLSEQEGWKIVLPRKLEPAEFNTPSSPPSRAQG